MKADKKSKRVVTALAILIYIAYGPILYNVLPEPRIYNEFS